MLLKQIKNFQKDYILFFLIKTKGKKIKPLKFKIY